MKIIQILVYLFVFIVFGCGHNYKDDTTNQKISNTEKKSEKDEPNSSELLDLAINYFDNNKIEESKKHLLILLKKYPESKESVKAKELLIKTNLELDKIAKIEDSIIREKEKAEKLKVEKATRNLRIKTDDLEGITWYYDKTSPHYASRNGFFIYIGDRGYKMPGLRWRIQYQGNNWLFIEKYIIYVDGLKYKTIIPEFGEVKRDNGYRGVWEWIDIPVSKHNDEIINDFTILSIIAISEDVKVRLIGKKYSKTITISNEQKNAINNVLNAYEALGGKIY